MVSQEEIKNFLIEMWKNGNYKYYTVGGLEKKMGTTQLRKKVNKLYAYGFLDIKNASYFPLVQTYRIKPKYVEVPTKNGSTPTINSKIDIHTVV